MKKRALAIPVVAITVQECHLPEGVMEQEKGYIAVLTSAAAYGVVTLCTPPGNAPSSALRFATPSSWSTRAGSCATPTGALRSLVGRLSISIERWFWIVPDRR